MYETEAEQHASFVLSPLSAKMRKQRRGNPYSRPVITVAGRRSFASAMSTSTSASASLDRDVLFHVTFNPVLTSQRLSLAAAELQRRDFHELSARDKVALLKILVDTCYDTKR